MATLNFPVLRFSSTDIKNLLTAEDTKNFNRLCIQFYRQDGDRFTLVAQVLGEGRKKIDVPLIFSTPLPDGPDGNSIKIDKDVILGQHELSRGQIVRLSDNGTKDLILKPRSIKINPDAVTYDANGNPLNPCPPADPPA